MITYTTEDRIEMLENAQEFIEQAIDQISEAVRGTRHQGAADAYIIAHLKNWANGDNPYDATAIPRLVEYLQNDE